MIEQIRDPTSTTDGRAKLLLEHARKEEELGNYEIAQSALKVFWGGLGSEPVISSYDPLIAGEILLRVGTLTGWLGAARKRKGAQDTARELLGKSILIFKDLSEWEKIADAQIGIAICYWRDGQFAKAREMLDEALSSLKDIESDQRARVYLNRAVVDNTAGQLHASLKLLTDHAGVFESSDNHTLKARFHTTLGNALHYLAAADEREDYIDRAFVEYAAASYHFEQAGNARHYIVLQNQLAYLCYTLGRYSEAHEYIDRGLHLAAELCDKNHATELRETRARVLIAENRNAEADATLQPVIRTLENGGDHVKLAIALTTYGILLARTGRFEEARNALEQATDAAELTGESETAGCAQLTILEEMGDRLHLDELAIIYERADQYLTKSQNPHTLARLRLCARQIINRKPQLAADFKGIRFIHASKESIHLLRNASRLAGIGGTILITGETGTGKELLARLIHTWSQCRGTFKHLSCGPLPINEFHGIIAGEATGTVFLDEIADLSKENQTLLLRMIEVGVFHDVGSISGKEQRLRLICSTSREMEELTKENFFRADLFYRLQTFRLDIPPLRERPEDIPELAKYFLRASIQHHRKNVSFTTHALDMMRRLPLRGNVRELRSMIDRTVSAADDGASITADAVEIAVLRQTQPEDFSDPWANCSLEEELLKYEASLITRALEESGGQITAAAKKLGLKHQHLSYIIESRQKQLLAVRKPAQKRRPTLKKKGSATLIQASET